MQQNKKWWQMLIELAGKILLITIKNKRKK